MTEPIIGERSGKALVPPAGWTDLAALKRMLDLVGRRWTSDEVGFDPERGDGAVIITFELEPGARPAQFWFDWSTGQALAIRRATPSEVAGHVTHERGLPVAHPPDLAPHAVGHGAPGGNGA